MNKIILCLDRLLCWYFGISDSKSTPQKLSYGNRGLMVYITDPFRRCVQKININQVKSEMMTEENQIKLGKALASVLGGRISVSFEEVEIKTLARK